MNNEIKRLNACYKEVQELRKNIDIKKYNSNKEINKHDRSYNWMFENDCVLKETKKELLEQFNNINYIHDIFYSYKEVLYNCQKESESEEVKRTCDECNKEMTKGYCIENGMAYYCSEKCLHKNMTEEEFNELYDNGNGDSYWTEWEC